MTYDEQLRANFEAINPANSKAKKPVLNAWLNIKTENGETKLLYAGKEVKFPKNHDHNILALKELIERKIKQDENK